MSKYDITFLLINEEDIIPIKELLTSLQGQILEEQSWGKKVLAYPIKKNHSALYYTWKIELTQKHIQELKQKLNFNEKIVRYLILNSEDVKKH